MKLIQPPTPVPESKIWSLSDEFYRERGEEAWSKKLVPQYITSNCYTADVYAAIIAAFFRDLASQGCREVPLIIEVGGGSGRFAWTFLHRFLHHHLPEGPARPAFNYLLTDGAPRNIENWKTKKRFAPLVESGLLDFGTLWVNETLEIRTEKSGVLTVDDLGRRPVVVISNYLHCSIPCDLYRVRDHRIYRELIALYELPPESVSKDGGPLHRLKARFTSEERAMPYTGYPGIDRVLESYRALPGDKCVPVPVQSIRFLEIFLRRDAPFLKLAGDLGYTNSATFRATDPFIFEDYLAYSTNFQMMGEIVREFGGTVQFPAFDDRTLSTVAFMRAGPLSGLPETVRAAHAHLSDFSPMDAYRVLGKLREHRGGMPTRYIAGALRLSRCDPSLARACLPSFSERVGENRATNPEHLREMLLEAYRAYFSDGSKEDVFDIEIAELFFQLGLHEDARQLLERGIAEFGRTPARLYSLAVALIHLERFEEARALVEGSLRLDNEFEPARKLLDAFRLEQREYGANGNESVPPEKLGRPTGEPH